MAEMGISGVRDCMESVAGFFNLYFRGDYEPKYLTDDLGKRFEGINISFKRWPCCRLTHIPISAALDIMREHDIWPQDVAEVTLYVSRDCEAICIPLEERRRPTTFMFASAQGIYPVAVAIAKREVTIGSFLPEGLKDPAILEIADKITPKHEPEFDGYSGTTPEAVEIKTKSGKTYSKRADIPIGNPKNPMTQEDFLTKFRDCVSYSAKPIAKEDIEKAIELLLNLEEVHDVRQIINLFS